MSGNNFLFYKLQSHLLSLKINTIWRLKYFLTRSGSKRTKSYLSGEKQIKYERPLVYSCSGCSSAAQMANYLAVQVDRKGVAEMSCIVGVGGNVKKLVHKASSGRKLITIDGCPLACSNACLGNHSLSADKHFDLTAMGVKKRMHEDFNLKYANLILERITAQVMELDVVT